MSYMNRAKERVLSQLLDQNNILTYNITRLKSPGKLEGYLFAKGRKFEFPYPKQIVNVAGLEKREETVVEENRKGFFSFFALRADAEAMTQINANTGAD